jgi:hypothetical protein
MDFYWELEQFDGTTTEIPPQVVDTVKRRLNDKDMINLKTMSIPANQVKSFKQTSKRYTDQLLIEDVARAFDEPILNADGSIVCKWVKKNVTQNEYNKFYSQSGYKKIGTDGSMVTVAFRLPVHSVDLNVLEYCTDDEVQQLGKY